MGAFVTGDVVVAPFPFSDSSAATVHESEVGAELELDHFQPRSIGGSDDLANLVYCCTACNRLKGDF